ncbi:MAG TPA: arginine--tRNA ligase [Planctomycetaceae bacterium]|nr:arginine--tRNA ligase [Planctomycetaceae bacterium]
MNWHSELQSRLRTALAGLVDDVEPYAAMLRPAGDPKFGDYQANCAMSLGKALKRPPPEVAKEIVAKLDVADLCDPPEVAGPGFINLRLRTDRLTAETNRLVTDDRLGVPLASPVRTYVVDYSSPNVAKPMHVGHLRSTVIGHALDNVLRFLGHRVISDNHIGDWGTQFGMILYGYKHFRDDAAYAAAPVKELARLYRLVNQLCDYHTLDNQLPELEGAVTRWESEVATARQTAATKPADKELAKQAKKLDAELAEARNAVNSARKKRQAVDESPELAALAKAHPQIVELSRKETAKLHTGDAENLALWRAFIPQCLAALEGMYQRFGVTFALTLGESYYNPMLSGVVDDLVSRGLAKESDGAMCVFVAGNAAPFIIRKADGAFTYATTDLATIQYRVNELHADAILYVVDSRQSEHFQLLFATAKQIGYDQVEFQHVSFGTILGDDRKPFKTRSGDTVGLESLLDEAVRHARAIVDENDNGKPNGPELDESQRAAIAEIVGIGGIIYADLHHNRDSDYVFNWEKMLAKTGDTATYIQYAYARVRGIFAQGQIDLAALRSQPAAIRLDAPAERQLARQLNRFAEAVSDVVGDYRPNLLTQYLFETANVFATFYEQCSVLREPDPALRTSRLLLCDLTARVLKQGLSLLGIGVNEKM